MSAPSTQTALIDRLRSLLAETFHVDPGEIGPETQFGDFPAWDSMGHMDLMVALESEFGLPVSAESISALTSVPAILEAIEGLPHD